MLALFFGSLYARSFVKAPSPENILQKKKFADWKKIVETLKILSFQSDFCQFAPMLRKVNPRTENKLKIWFKIMIASLVGLLVRGASWNEEPRMYLGGKPNVRFLFAPYSYSISRLGFDLSFDLSVHLCRKPNIKFFSTLGIFSDKCS